MLDLRLFMHPVAVGGSPMAEHRYKYMGTRQQTNACPPLTKQKNTP